MAEQIIEKIGRYLSQEQIMAQLDLAPIKEISFLAQGEYNRNFLITDTTSNKIVFRMNYGSQINVKQQARYEYHALQILYKSQHTPEPLYLDDTKRFFQHDILIETFLPGEPLVYHRDLHRAAEIFAAIHNLQLKPAAYAQLKSETKICSARLNEANQLLKAVRDSSKINSEQSDLLFALKDWCTQHNADEHFLDQPMCLVNTEVNSNNFLITADYGWLIDWEKPVISNAVQDLTQFIAETTTLWRTSERLTTEQTRLFLTTYAKLTGQRRQLLETNINLYMPFLLLRALSWCGMLVATYADKPIQNVEILKRCQSFLQLDFSVPLLKKYGVNL
ncbi:phosphotransferase [Loigolactobacillus backii]|uniref:Phosphotransferase n=1 Tax=Loigolactobacillus backii TaxID=375175 RepID=A0A192H130_9LACO|nr:phosphotransferase [Loigolactobacillus backii]ANK61988.1 phosphotransferase [Loigolactobacillus backii]ANK65396.1 phosphotransferase [Loigolactobacillus backii]ANK68818.1 phosphotransferase [Loigolactobacillus backii]